MMEDVRTIAEVESDFEVVTGRSPSAYLAAWRVDGIEDTAQNAEWAIEAMAAVGYRVAEVERVILSALPKGPETIAQAGHVYDALARHGLVPLRVVPR